MQPAWQAEGKALEAHAATARPFRRLGTLKMTGGELAWQSSTITRGDRKAVLQTAVVFAIKK